MTEVEATVESEHTPEPKWPERILIEQNGICGMFRATAEFIDEAERLAKRDGHAYRILRVSPPVARRVEIDWEAVNRRVSDAAFPADIVRRIIEAHARIVEEPKR